ncbi:MAG: hypothetical protein ABIJ21_09315 [Nanoarchaeota archaeon]
MNDIDQFKAKYAERMTEELEGKESVKSKNYQDFREEYLPKSHTLYEKACGFSQKALSISPGKDKERKYREALSACHLNATPTGVISFSYLAALTIVLFGIVFGYLIPSFLGQEPVSFFVLLALLLGAIVIIPLQQVPFILANSWRLKTSNQMVLATFYMVTYMRHTSNLELAINFAAEHVASPLSIDLKKIIWDIETEKYGNVKEALDIYLDQWKDSNREFIEAVQLIESSLYEPAENRRLTALDKSLEVILQGTYDKMLHFAHALKNPITTLHMMGIILPILGLVILPLATNFLGNVRWYHIFALYNLILPIIVFYYGKSILSTRPTGYGAPDLSDEKSMKAYKNITLKVGKSPVYINPAFVAIILFSVLFLIAISPFLIHAANPKFDCVYSPDDYAQDRPDFFCATEFEEDLTPKAALLEYQPVRDEEGNTTGEISGPFGIGATMLSLLLTLAFGLSLGTYYTLRTKRVMKIREESKKLEEEFASALFQLGNRLGDGIPAEIAFAKVAIVMKGTVSGDFFSLVSLNIRKLGMGLEDAIFDSTRGAVVYYPSHLIESSMKVLVESAKKGPLIASQALINVSEYIKEMHRVDERLKDLLSDVSGSMESQIHFLTPAIAGIVVGITSMITKIMILLSGKLESMGRMSPDANYGSILSILGGGNAIPTYHFQAIVGLYVVQITFILTILVNGINNGNDKLNEKYLLGKYLTTSTITYVFIAFAVMLVFTMISGSIITAINS